MLDAVETDEVGLSIAYPAGQSGCSGKKAESKITDDTNVHVRDPKNPMVNTALTPILRWRRCICSNVLQSFQNLADDVTAITTGRCVKVMTNKAGGNVVARDKAK